MKKAEKFKLKKVKELVIDRAKWGVGDMGGGLRNSKTGLQCCLGFACRAFGVSKETLRLAAMPRFIRNAAVRMELPKWLRAKSSETANPRSCHVDYAARTNDRTDITQELREARVKRFFKQHGIKVTFVGELPK